MPRAASPGDGRPDWLAVSYLLGALLLLYYLFPLASLLAAGSPSRALASLADPDVRSAAAVSVTTAATSTLVATALGLPLAYWLARTEGRWRNVVTSVALFPLVLPPVVSGMVLLLVVGPDTAVGRAAASVGVSLTQSPVGVVLAQTFVASPFVVVTATAAFEDVDRRLEEAARTLGTTRARTFRQVTLPLARSGVAAGMTLAFARSLGEFGATLMVAYYPRTMPVQIWVAFTTRGLDAAFPVAVVLVGVGVGVLAVLTALGDGFW